MLSAVKQPGVVIPVHNEAGTIGRLLDGLAGLAGDAEVAVVCNGSAAGR